MNCKVCNAYSGKRNVCGNCKAKFPFQASGKEGKPFNRKQEFLSNLNYLVTEGVE